MVPTAVLAALAVLIAATLFGRRTVDSPLLARLRTLFPAWRFFDRATGSSRLWVRSGAPGEALGPWLPVDGARRSWGSALFAPASNLALAYHAVVEQLVSELDGLQGDAAAPGADGQLAIETHPQIVGRVSYELVGRVARTQVPAALRGRPGARFQWKVTVPDQEEALVDFLLSPELAP